MELFEIDTVFRIETGAPCPTMVSTEEKIFLSFFIQNKSELLQQPTPDDDLGIITLVFSNYSGFRSQSINNEVISGHPYAKLGLNSYGFFELKNSDWIEEIKKINKVHARYSEENFLGRKHFILTFHDTIFECIGNDYEVTIPDKESLFEVTSSNLKILFSRK